MTDFSEVDVTDFNLVIEGVRVYGMKIPNNYVSDAWAPNTTDHHIFDGNAIKDGMVVVIADSLVRANPEKLTEAYQERNPLWKGPTDHDRADIDRTARWAIVTNSKVRFGILHFNAVYADGTIFPRSYNVDWKWAVRKNVEASPYRRPNFKYLDLNSLFESILGFKFDPHFVDRMVQEGMKFEESNLKNSTAGNSDEKVSDHPPYNFKKALRDADSLSKVAAILRDRNAYLKNRIDEDPLSNPEKMTRIQAKKLQIGDILFVAGTRYEVNALNRLEGFEGEIYADLKNTGFTTLVEKSITFESDEIISIIRP